MQVRQGTIERSYHVPTRRHKKSTHLREGEARSVNSVLLYLKRLIRLCLDRLHTRFVQWTRPFTPSLLLGIIADLGRSKSDLMAENALLRQQLIILRRQVKRPACSKTDRVLIVLLARVVRTWKQVHITRSTRDTSGASIVSSSACTGSAGQRPLHTSTG